MQRESNPPRNELSRKPQPTSRARLGYAASELARTQQYTPPVRPEGLSSDDVYVDPVIERSFDDLANKFREVRYNEDGRIAMIDDIHVGFVEHYLPVQEALDQQGDNYLSKTAIFDGIALQNTYAHTVGEIIRLVPSGGQRDRFLATLRQKESTTERATDSWKQMLLGVQAEIASQEALTKGLPAGYTTSTSSTKEDIHGGIDLIVTHEKSGKKIYLDIKAGWTGFDRHEGTAIIRDDGTAYKGLKIRDKGDHKVIVIHVGVNGYGGSIERTDSSGNRVAGSRVAHLTEPRMFMAAVKAGSIKAGWQ